MVSKYLSSTGKTSHCHLVLVLCVLKKFFRNSACISVYFFIVLGLRELSQILALSFKVKGKAFNHSNSISITPSLKSCILPQNPGCVCIFIFHTMEGWEQGHQIRPDTHILGRRYNTCGCTHPWWVYMVPH